MTAAKGRPRIITTVAKPLRNFFKFHSIPASHASVFCRVGAFIDNKYNSKLNHWYPARHHLSKYYLVQCRYATWK